MEREHFKRMLDYWQIVIEYYTVKLIPDKRIDDNKKYDKNTRP